MSYTPTLHSIILFILITLFAPYIYANGLSENASATLYEHLYEVNNEWLVQNTFETPVLNQEIKFYTDKERIKLHLRLVEHTLRKKETNHLSKQQKLKRLKHLEVLNTYWKAGIFPVNTYHPHRQPYFIDIYGNACAVGYLLIKDGQEDFAYQVAKENNFAYIHELQHTTIVDWAFENGFTIDELAWIQPSYKCDMHGERLGNNGGTHGKTIHEMKSLTLNQQEYLFIGGDFTKIDDVDSLGGIVYWDGANYHNLGTGINGVVYAIEAFNDTIYIGGDFKLYGNTIPVNLAYWDGNNWVATKTGNIQGTVRTLKTYNCALYIGGSFTTINSLPMPYLATWNGTNWSQQPNNCVNNTTNHSIKVNAPVYCLETVLQDKLGIGGYFTGVGEPLESANYMAIWDGSTWFYKSNGFNTPVYSMFDDYSRIVLGGDLRDPFGITALIAWTNNPNDWIWEPLNYASFEPAFDSIIHDFSSTQGLLVGGIQSGIDVAASTTMISSFSSSTVVNGTIRATAHYKGLDYFAGDFTEFGSYTQDNSFNNIVAGFIDIALPIQLTSFDGRLIDNKQVALEWTTATEQNNKHFEIQRRNREESFKTIGIVSGAINSTREHTYFFSDNVSNIKNSEFYYRLKQVDLDGTYTYSKTIAIKIDKENEDIRFYPNPTPEKLTISLKNIVTDNVLVTFFNTQGKCVLKGNFPCNNQYDSWVKEIDISMLPSGSFIVHVQAGTAQYQQLITHF